MKYNLITSFNGAGLGKDAELMRKLLESYGHEVICTQFNAPIQGRPLFDVNIFLEVVNPEWLSYGGQNWIMPNTEWWYPQWDCLLPQIQKVLCKTRDCEQIWSRKVGLSRVFYTGFEAFDHFRVDVSRQRAFLHIAGNSEAKNSAVILAAWRQFNLPYKLHVSGEVPGLAKLCSGLPSVSFDSRFEQETLVRLLNECRFHVLPSRNEGYGHAIHEGLGCEGVVLTTDAPPMNEFLGIDKRALIPVHHKNPRLDITLFYEVTPEGVRDTVQRMIALSDNELDVIGKTARAGFLTDRQFFHQRLREVVNQ